MFLHLYVISQWGNGIIVPSPTSINPLEVGFIASPFSKTQTSALAKLWQTVPEGWTDDSPSFPDVAFHNYEFAVIEARNYAQKCAYAVMAIEGLLIGASENELSYKLALRCARLFSLCPPARSASDWFKRTKDLYSVRSIYVHGTCSRKQLDKKCGKIEKCDGSEDVLCEFLDMVRASIAIAAVFKSREEGLREALDECILSGTPSSELRDTIEEMRPVLFAFRGPAMPCGSPPGLPGAYSHESVS
ncbi:MAG: hypothetical protein WC712_13040 [Candidatus Brocadiia bacterium]